MRIISIFIAILLYPGLAWAFNPLVLFDTSKLDDGGYTESAYNGVLAFEKYLSKKVTILTPDKSDIKPESGFENLVAQAAENSYDPIVSVGFSYESSFVALAPKYPDTHFIIIDAVVPGPNVQSIVFREEEGSFLVGYLAGMATHSQKVGFVGGLDCELIRKFGCAYAQGVWYMNPSIEVFSAMAGDTVKAWINPERGAQLARELIAQGVDVIYHASGMTGDGVIQAAAEADIWAIGVDSNQNHMAPGNMLTSMLKRMDVAVFLALSQVAEGRWRPGVLQLGLKEGAIDWALDEHNVVLITDDMQDRMDDLSFEILAGLLKVYKYTDADKCPYIDFGPYLKKSSED